MRFTPYKGTKLPPFDAGAFSPFVHDPIGQYLCKLYRGDMRPPFGRLLATAGELWDGVEKDPETWDALERILSDMRTAWVRELKARSIGQVRKGFAPNGHAHVWQRGGEDPETGDRYYLRLPTSQMMGARLVGKILGAEIGFPVVSLTQHNGRSWPVYLLGDATDLLARAHERKWHNAQPRRGRPPNVWAVAREIEAEEVAKRMRKAASE